MESRVILSPAFLLLDGRAFTKKNVEFFRFSHSSLRCCCFESAKMRGCDFSHSSLQSCNFNGADMRDCVLLHADLSGSDLRGANLIGSKMTERGRLVSVLDFCLFDEGTMFPEGVLELWKSESLSMK